MTVINGLVEIGYPGRFLRGFQQHYQVTGTIAVVNDTDPAITDLIQTGYPRPSNLFAKLDYNAPSLASLVTSSAMVITCYIGLHHFPHEALTNFLTEINRILQAGGCFILVDHDINSEATMSMAHMAHTLFNAVNGETIENEMSEIRNFKPMSFWTQQIKQNGLILHSNDDNSPKIRENDPSRNRMMCFQKPNL